MKHLVKHALRQIAEQRSVVELVEIDPTLSHICLYKDGLTAFVDGNIPGNKAEVSDYGMCFSDKLDRLIV